MENPFPSAPAAGPGGGALKPSPDEPKLMGRKWLTERPRTVALRLGSSGPALRKRRPPRTAFPLSRDTHPVPNEDFSARHLRRSAGAPRDFRWCVALLPALAWLFTPDPAQAYIGPGAGFALVSSFFVLFTTILLVIASLLIWPFRKVFQLIRYRGRPKPWIERLIIVGFDGQDPQITNRLLAQGRLPNFKRLAASGCYHPLATTYPAISPVAWSSFAVGANPAKHNIFDFLTRDRRTYLPMLSSTEIGSVDKIFRLGKWRIPLQKPVIRLLRKSRPFWSILGEHRNWSTVLRVPITFPPDRFYGAQLSAMCAPDLLGTQGTFFFYTTRESKEKFKEGGLRFLIRPHGDDPDHFEMKLQGPENAFLEGNPPMEIPMTLDLDRQNRRGRLEIAGTTLDLEPMVLSDWVPLTFDAAPTVKVRGLVRCMLKEMDEHVSLYLTPISMDPDKPSMPISHPSYYAPYLAKTIGHFCTLGLAEDTWALNEGVTDDATFLQQTYDIDREREAMFWHSFEQMDKGSLTCVFDGTDRVQHMFWRYTEDGHPAARGIVDPEHKHAIEEFYEHNDRLVGKLLDRAREGDVIMVISDHGCVSFRRGVNLNRWLLDNGYLALKEDADPDAEWLQNVDWSRTKAYVLGLTGMFLNLKGREAHGIVQPGDDARAVKAEIASKLNGLRDPDTGDLAIIEMFDTEEIYDGPYMQNAPDLIIGFNDGYRVSWDCASGMVSTPVFEDNVKAWSGDHCVDPRLVPGVFFCNHPIAIENPDIIDIAPTALQLFGLPPAAHMEGRPLFADLPLRASGNHTGTPEGNPAGPARVHSPDRTSEASSPQTTEESR